MKDLLNKKEMKDIEIFHRMNFVVNQPILGKCEE